MHYVPGLFMQYGALQRPEGRKMDHMITAEINGEERLLNYSIEVMFKVNDKFGGVNNALDAIEKDTRECVENVLWLLTELANDGELCRRSAGYDHKQMLSPEDISMRMSPLEYLLLKEKVIQAIFAGYGKETENEEEVDLGLAELNEKKAPAGA